MFDHNGLRQYMLNDSVYHSTLTSEGEETNLSVERALDIRTKRLQNEVVEMEAKLKALREEYAVSRKWMDKLTEEYEF